ncbi:MAG: sigma-54 dependent transcriptional regulator [Bacteroidota bacterium]
MDTMTLAKTSDGTHPEVNTLKVLILDDEKQLTEELHEFLENRGFVAFEAQTGEQGLALLERVNIDLMILDVRLPGMNGLDILKLVRTKFPAMEVIIISAHGDMDTVIKAMRLGAIDYLRKPFRHLDVQLAIERTEKFLLLQQKMRLLEEKSSLISKNLSAMIERSFIGVSLKLQDVLETAMIAAQFPDTNVLITGESGTGKENIARIIHFESSRKNNLFWAVNSSSITDSLLESEFFGHKKGSFTGALSDKKGFFEICDQGTLFLDEIADMPMNLQAKILRAIEEKTITRVGDTNKTPTNFRIISATNRNLNDLVDEKIFRLDLMHRLNTLQIQMPPLRDHSEDIEPLLNYFVEDFSHKFNKPVPKVGKEVVHLLKSYLFPGNVRELKNMAERAVILCRTGFLTVRDFPVELKEHKKQKDTEPAKLDIKMNEVELIRQALKECAFNQKNTADKLGITRDALIRRMKKYSILIHKSQEDPLPQI